MTWHSIPGLARKIWLPDWIQFAVHILPATQTKQRPGYSLWHPPKWIGHETGNYRPGTDALMHLRYLQNGAGGQYVSYHLTGDDQHVYMMIPADEVTWQAACGACWGNYGCWSYEQCVNPETDQAKARDVHEWVAAAFLEAGNVPALPVNITRHWDHNAGTADRHECPQLMLRDNYWPTFQQRTAAKWQEIRERRDAVENPTPPPPPQPVYADPVLPDWFDRQDAAEHPSDQKFRNRTAYVCKRNYRALSGTVRRSEPTTKAAKSGPNVVENEKVFGIRLWVNPEDKRTWILEETGHWLLASKFTPRVRIDPRTAD